MKIYQQQKKKYLYNLIQPILDKIDEIQNEIEEL